MKLLDPSFNAPDVLYNNIQKPIDSYEPPDLAQSHVEELYQLTSQILDSNFRTQIQYDFASRYCEMYFAGVILDRLKLEIAHPSDEGPDFFLSDFNCWVEVTKATDGDESSENKIPQPILEEVNDYPENEIILRLSNSFASKANKLKTDIEKGIIQPHQAVILCISGGWLSDRIPSYAVGSYPQIVKALLPMGDQVFWIGQSIKEIVKTEHKYRERCLSSKLSPKSNLFSCNNVL